VQDRLFVAVIKDDLMGVKRFIEAGAGVNDKMEYVIEEPSTLPFETTVKNRKVKISPLCLALLKSHWSIAKYLISKHASVDFANTRYSSECIFYTAYPFIFACPHITPPDDLLNTIFKVVLNFNPVFYTANPEKELRLLLRYPNVTILSRILFLSLTRQFNQLKPGDFINLTSRHITIDSFKSFMNGLDASSLLADTFQKNIKIYIEENLIDYNTAMEMVDIVVQKSPASLCLFEKLPPNFRKAVMKSEKRKLSDLCFEFNMLIDKSGNHAKNDPRVIQQFLNQDITEILVQLYAINLDPNLRNRGYENNPVVLLLGMILFSHANTLIQREAGEDIALLDVYHRSQCKEVFETYFSLTLDMKMRLRETVMNQRLQQTLEVKTSKTATETTTEKVAAADGLRFF
jgi:hypothetical protein